MNDTATITELPVLPELNFGYRNLRKDNGLFNRLYVATHPGVALRTPEELMDLSYPNAADAVSVWNEAHNENNRRTASEFTAAEDVDPVALIKLDDLRAQVANQHILIDQLRATIRGLEEDQIDGSDPRLSDFWKKAQELADNAGHCSVYDDLSEDLGGPRRRQDYVVEVPVTVAVQVSVNDARDESSAIQQARHELIRSTITEALDNHTKWDADWDEAEAEVTE